MIGGAGIELWRVSFEAPGPALPALLDPLEAIAPSVSAHEKEADAEARTTRWQVELIVDTEPELTAMARRLSILCEPFGFRPDILAVERLLDADWLTLTAQQAKPVAVGRFFVHGEAHRGSAPASAWRIQVEAGLAFGSGEHATTQACLEALGKLRLRRRPARILDLGCGSGVLGIAAARRWTVPVLLADNDPAAVEVAGENAARNGVAGRVRAVLSEGWEASAVRRQAPYDLVLANILADPLIAMARPLARALAPGGHAILSGFVERDAERVLGAHRIQHLRLVQRIARDPWVALVLRR